jgi:hypothetical protein
MANAIDLVVEKQALDQVKNLVSLLTEADNLILKFSADTRSLSSTLSQVKTPNDLSNRSNSNNTQTEQLNIVLKQQDNLEKALISTLAKKELATESTNKALIKERVALNAVNKEIADQAREALKNVGAYSLLNKEHQKLAESARDLGARLGTNAPEFLKAAAASNELLNRLKLIDNSLGVTSRNVGNYNGKFNGLGNSIQQILREAPAAAVSLNTFFLGISNNLPVFFDNITQIKEELKLLTDAASASNDQLSAQQALTAASASVAQDAENALAGQIETIVSSIGASSEQALAIREKITAEVSEIRTTGRATAATIANTDAALVNAGATTEQIAATRAQITSTGAATRAHASQTAALQAQTVATAEANAAAASTPGIMARVVSSLFSINTLLTVGVLALTLYGGKLIELVAGLFEVEKALYTLEQRQKDYNDTLKDANVNFQKEVDVYRQYRDIASDLSKPYKERKIAIDQLRSTYAFWLESLSDEQIANLKGTEIEGKILAAKKANADYDRASKNVNIISERKEQYRQELRDKENFAKESERLNKIIKEGTTVTTGGSSAGIGGTGAVSLVTKDARLAREALTALNKSEETRLELIKDEALKGASASQIRRLLITDEKNLTEQQRLANKYKQEAIPLEYKAEKKKKERKEKREDILVASEGLRQDKSFLQVLEEQVRIFTEAQKEVSDTSQEYKNFQNVIDGLRQSIDLIIDPSKVLKVDVSGLEKGQKEIEATNKSLEKMKEILNSFTDQFSEGFFSQAGLPTLFKILRDEIKGFGIDAATTALATTEAFQEMFNLINSASQQNFDAEYQRLESQNTIAIEFAGKSDAAKAQVERDAEQRKIAIQKRELKAQKEIAKFNIIIDTAQAVISAFANPGGVAGIALAALAVVTGAIQLAAVNAQQIPQYWEGGIHTGGKMMVNDDPHGRKGSNFREVVRTPDGKIFKPQGKNVIMNAPAGTEIFPNYQSWENSLNSMLYGNGIEPLQGVISYENKKQASLDTDRILSGLGYVAESINNKPVGGMEISDGEMKSYIIINNKKLYKANCAARNIRQVFK